MSIEKKNPISLYGAKYNDRTLYYKIKMIDSKFHVIYNLMKKYFDIRTKEVNDILHDKIKYEELLIKLSESRNNILSDKTKRILINKINNVIVYIETFLLKKEYEEKLEFKIIDWNYFYNLLRYGRCPQLYYHANLQRMLSRYLLKVASIDDDKLYQIISENEKIDVNNYDDSDDSDDVNNYDEIIYEMKKKYSFWKDNKVIEDLNKIIEKFKKYFKYNTRNNVDDYDSDDSDDYDERYEVERYYDERYEHEIYEDDVLI